MDPDAREAKYERSTSENTSLNREDLAMSAGVDRSLPLAGTSQATYKGGEFGKGETTEWEDILVKKGKDSI
jgi:hypothetical protein